MTLTIETRGPVTHIQLNRPRLHNMLNRCMLEELAQTLQDLDARVIILSGAGPSFCAGADAAELRRAAVHDIHSILRAGRRAYQALLASDAITIAVVHGQATGAGLALAAGCDLRIAHPQATFSLPELTHGLSFSWAGAMPRLLDEIGPGPLRRIAFLSETVTAERAAAIGLVHEIDSEPHRLADQWATGCANFHPHSVALTKRQLRSYTRTWGNPGVFDEDLLAAGIHKARQAATGLFAQSPRPQ